jgi:hypothetical protein
MSPHQNWDSPTPSPASECAPARNQRGGTAGEEVGESQFRQLKKRLSTLSTLWMKRTTIDFSLERWVHFKVFNTLCSTWTSLKAWMRVSPSSSPLHSHWCSELYTCIWQFTVQLAVHLDMTIFHAVSCTPGYDNLQCSELYTWIWQFKAEWAVHQDMTIFNAVSCTPGYDNSQ